MGTGKILGGLAFLILGIVILVIGIVPIPGLGGLSLYERIVMEYNAIVNLMATFNIQTFIQSSGYLSLATILPWVGAHYCIAGVKSMRHRKPKKQYFVTETKIGLMIAGFIMICVATAIVLMIFIDVMAPSFGFLNSVNPTLPSELSWLSMILPQMIIPVVLTIMIIFFVYWIGSKIMKSGVKKEELI